MKNNVSFETAKRLKDAGFPQPEFSIRQTWYAYLYPEIWEDGTEFYIANTDPMRFITISDAKLSTTGVQDSTRQGEIYGGSVVFAPTATDILEHLSYALQIKKGIGCIFNPEYIGAAKSTADQQMYFQNANPAEAAAAAWLDLNEKK